MIFEIMDECNEKKTVTVIMDNHTFNQVLTMVIVEVYHKGLDKNADVDTDNSKEN